MRLLLVEDDQPLAFALRKAFVRENYAVDVADNGASADHLLSVQSYDLVILDLGLPKLDGQEVLQKLRKRGDKVPVVILTARSSINHKIFGLDLGADDYITKPFDLSELLARVRANLRRGANQTEPTISHGRLRYDAVAKRVFVDDKELSLRAKELGVLEILLRSVGRVLSKQQLAEHLYSFDDHSSDNAIEIYVHRLRKQLPHDSFRLRTVRGIGYLLEPPE
ncbi:MAG: response regulator transcription factor [Woeseiaceae bacterium]|nr:response regulator transcription factor [Woeseiaceae bacterium]